MLRAYDVWMCLLRGVCSHATGGDHDEDDQREPVQRIELFDSQLDTRWILPRVHSRTKSVLQVGQRRQETVVGPGVATDVSVHPPVQHFGGEHVSLPPAIQPMCLSVHREALPQDLGGALEHHLPGDRQKLVPRIMCSLNSCIAIIINCLRNSLLAVIYAGVTKLIKRIF